MTAYGSRLQSVGVGVVLVCAAVFGIWKPDAVSAQMRWQQTASTDVYDSLEFTEDIDDTACLDFNDILPPFFSDQITLKHYIRDARFLELRRICGDTVAVDAIFLRAMDIADGDIEHALLVSLCATMDHFRLGLKIPLLGVLWLPLTEEANSVFRVRRLHLPRRMLPDSIGRTVSDKDKLQHFFGSAYIAYLTNSHVLTTVFGNMLEVGEEAFVVGGVNDERDKFANRLGQKFGLRLLDGEPIVPSDVLWKKND